MKIAVTYENGEVFQHFGHCGNFRIYETDGDRIEKAETVSAAGSGHGALAGFLKNLNVEALICGGIGGGAREALADAGISLYPGVSGNADRAVQELLAGKLVYNPDETCSHHHEGECGNGEAGGSCGHHGEADGTCGHHEKENGGCGHRENGTCGEDHHGCRGNF